MKISLVPTISGREIYTVDPVEGVFVSPGSGFDSDNPQHWTGTDLVRWAIRLQQLRDAGEYLTLDKAKTWLTPFCFVMQERQGIRLLGKPSGWGDLSNREKRKAKPFIRMQVFNSIIYDAELLPEWRFGK